MTHQEHRVVIVDMPHREGLFAEIWIDDEQFGEVYLIGGKACVEVYPPRRGNEWKFRYETLKDIINSVDDFLNSMVDYQEE